MKHLVALVTLMFGLFVGGEARAQYWDDVPEPVQTVSLDGLAATTVTGTTNGYYSIECNVVFYMRAGAGASAGASRAYAARPGSTAYVHLRAGWTTFSLFSESSGTCYVFRHGVGR